ncbi:MAG TPA: phenylalanine--tRNA ligase subunit alpha [Bacteroidales bacterium]|mgnify:FL=1|nr:phenylalanine--tRNA ligase subunit alpha [Bacteroidales bacterium]HPS26340.1 phenylalanine--tRNA ligase subunit alpha [Bacteroidales bacterium]
MEYNIKRHLDEIASFSTTKPDELEQFRIKYLGKNGILNTFFEEFKAQAPQQKQVLGKLLNSLKQAASEKYNTLKNELDALGQQEIKPLDLTLNATNGAYGARHPMSIIRQEIIEIFSRLGFTVTDGPEIEDDWHNFTALNFQPDHPAREMQDTFFIEQNPDIVLRTHTSSVQVRLMQNQQPPLRVLMPGRVYRNEAISARAHCFFNQVEGLYIDKNVSFADLKQTLLYFSKEMFGADTKIRLRPSYFPFTEPSAEMDISCSLCGGKGCPMCKKTGWVEILGCGMVDPNVLENCHIDSKVYTGYAFGMGIERITNLKYAVKDLRLFSENDIRFLKQFENNI